MCVPFKCQFGCSTLATVVPRSAATLRASASTFSSIRSVRFFMRTYYVREQCRAILLFESTARNHLIHALERGSNLQLTIQGLTKERIENSNFLYVAYRRPLLNVPFTIRTTRKPGRNDLCWCGSGRKYKRCHWNRENQAPVPSWSAAKEFKAAHSSRLCLVPKNLSVACSGKIVGAHTVPRSGSLERIAKDGHVYGWPFPDLNEMAKHDGVPRPTQIGVKSASTFPGFCATHDNAIFKPIENEKIVFSAEQCFLFGYRALAYEKYMKDAQANSIGIIRDVDKGWNFGSQQVHQAHVGVYADSVQLGANDMARDKALYDKVLISKDYSSVRSYIVKFEKSPTIMCSGRLAPVYDFSGAQLQDGCDPDVKLRHLSVSSFAVGEVGGAVVLTWLKDSDDICIRFVRSLHATGRALLADALTRLMFENLQNIYWSPTWWDNQPDESKAALIKRFADATDIAEGIDPKALAPDGRSYNDWGRAEIEMIGFKI